MSSQRSVPDVSAAAALVRDFDLARAPAEFIDDPYPYYAALRTHDPVHAMPAGVLLTRYEDVLAV